jgi:N-acetylmuramoyl-L-alanine amidase
MVSLGQRTRWCAVFAALVGGVCCGVSAAQAGGWDTAVRARAAFEAEAAGTHTKVEYARVMDGFRAIYHAKPNDAHAALAVEQVAELLAEEGRELHDAKSLKDAVGQYAFLGKAYPAFAKRAERAEAALGASASEPSDAAVVRTPPFHEERERMGHPAVVAASPTSQSRDVGHPVSEAGSTVAMVTGIRHWSTATYTRVAIDLGNEVQYEAARVENPDRIYFDLHNARLAPGLAGKSFAVTDEGGFLTRIRAAQYDGDITRVVLDVHEVGEYSAFLLPNPYRLIIDIHGKQEKQGVGSREQGVASGGVTQGGVAPVERVSEAAVSSLPAMPVTDGSAESGLAAVSEQPGKVEATRRPTSLPVSERVAAPATVAMTSDAGHYRKPVRGADVAARAAAVPGPVVDASTATAAPARAAEPTADGETSLMRALGLKIGRIVIDAGHGGHDSGTLGVGGIEEKDVVLDVALRLGKLLHDRLGAEIVYTRSDDTFIPLETRTAIANKAQADLFISVHANSSPDASARGVEVYYLNFTSDAEAMRVASRENAVSTQSVHELSDLVKKIALKDKIDESKELAGDVDAALYAGLARGNPGLRDRGVKKAPFVVLIGANMPSILAEISFVTNASDAEELRTPEYRERVAESLYAGVARYAAGINGVKPKPRVTERAAVKGK